jgi:xyloglucan 6-xylosyltransferase
MEMFYNTADLDHLMTGFWTKLPLLRNMMLAHPEVEWLWWMDSDAMFTDMSFQVPLEKYQSYNLVLHGFNDSVYKNKSWTGLNTGSFLIRNCQWSLDLLDAWSPMGPKGSIRDKAGTSCRLSRFPSSLKMFSRTRVVSFSGDCGSLN